MEFSESSLNMKVTGRRMRAVPLAGELKFMNENSRRTWKKKLNMRKSKLKLMEKHLRRRKGWTYVVFSTSGFWHGWGLFY